VALARHAAFCNHFRTAVSQAFVNKLYKASKRAQRVLQEFPASPRKSSGEWLSSSGEWLSHLHLGAGAWHSQASSAQRETVDVGFSIRYQCNFGQKIYLLGSDDALGAWDVQRAVPLSWSDGDVWTVNALLQFGWAAARPGGVHGDLSQLCALRATCFPVLLHPPPTHPVHKRLPLPSATPPRPHRCDAEYKYLVRNWDGSVARWQDGGNQQLSLDRPQPLAVTDSWCQSERSCEWAAGPVIEEVVEAQASPLVAALAAEAVEALEDEGDEGSSGAGDWRMIPVLGADDGAALLEERAAAELELPAAPQLEPQAQQQQQQDEEALLPAAASSGHLEAPLQAAAAALEPEPAFASVLAANIAGQYQPAFSAPAAFSSDTLAGAGGIHKSANALPKVALPSFARALVTFRRTATQLREKCAAPSPAPPACCLAWPGLALLARIAA
jgi:hypothetical protein